MNPVNQKQGDTMLNEIQYIDTVLSKLSMMYQIEAPELAGKLRMAGFRVLGQGKCAVVIKHPYRPGFVMRVSYRETEDRVDTCFEYYAWCQRTSSKNPCVPTVPYHRQYSKVYIAVLPQYIQLSPDEQCVAREVFLHERPAVSAPEKSMRAFGTLMRRQGLSTEDVMGDNIMITKSGQYKVIDAFGAIWKNTMEKYQ